MKSHNPNEKIKQEKEKLNELIDLALKKGIPLSEDESIMFQNRKIDALVFKIQKQKEREKNQER